jgi:hypothetical protein
LVSSPRRRWGRIGELDSICRLPSWQTCPFSQSMFPIRFPMTNFLSPVDYLVIVAYLCGTMAIGFWVGSYVRSGSDFFLAGRSLPWWAIGISLVRRPGASGQRTCWGEASAEPHAGVRTSIPAIVPVRPPVILHPESHR